MRQRSNLSWLAVPALALTLAAGAAGGLLSAGCGRRAPEVRLEYIVRVQGDASKGALVEVRAHGPLPHGFRLLLPPHGPRRELKAFELPADAPPGAIPVILYRVAAPEAPHGGPGFACYRGFELFAQPAGTQPAHADSVTLEFRLPDGVRVVAPLRELARDAEAAERGPMVVPMDEFHSLLASYCAIGDYGVRVLPPVPGRLPAVVWGRRGLGSTSEGELIDLVERLLVAHAGTFGPDRLDSPYSVVVDYPYEGHGFAGNATGRSIDLRLSRDMGPDDSPGLARLTAHELAHFWLGGAFPFPRAEDHWFVEGAADYYGLHARVAAGLTDEAAAGDELAGHWFELTGNRWLHEPIEDLGRNFTLDPEAFVASYARGCVTTWALDWRARQLGRVSVAEALREHAASRTRPSLEALFVTLLRGGDKAPAGADPAGDVGALMGHAPETALTRILGEAGLTFRTVPTRSLTFGLERFEPGTTRLMTVPQGTPAHEAGVQPGDAIRAVDGLPVYDTVDLQAAIERSYARPAYKLEGMEVTYERAGTFNRVRLFAAPQVDPQWADATGERATRVFP